MVSLTQRLVRMQQEKSLKEKVDTLRHREAVLKVRVQPWIDEEFIIIASIEANFSHMQGMQEQMQGSSSDTVVSKQCV